MDSSEWEKLWDIFHQACEMNPAERADFLNQIDKDLRKEVEELLSAENNNGQSFDEIVSKEFILLEKPDSVSEFEIKPETVLAGRFRILRELGRGGMGTVYEAFDEELGSSVALKTMHPDLIADSAARERFHREINLARKVTHPNACRIFDLFQHEDLLFLTMELLEGETLHQKIKRDGPLQGLSTIDIVLQVLDTLSEMHRLGIIHRDLKTSNILLVPNGKGVRAVVTDFGLAVGLPGTGSLEVTQTGQVLGTPQYMAPEQLKREAVTAATDVYALGLVMYEMLTGRLPLDGESPLTIAAKRISEEAPSPKLFVPDLDRKWERIILRCLERNPKHRFQNATEMTDAVKGKSFTEWIPLIPSRHRSRVTLGLFILLMSAFLIFYFWPAKNSSTNSDSDVIARRIWAGATGMPAGALSTDGKILIDIDWEKANVMSINLASKKKRLLTKSNIWFHPFDYIAHPVATLLSPDSKQVAYSIGPDSGSGSELRSVSTAGSTLRTLFRSDDVWITPLDWSSDGRHIAAHFLNKDGSVEIGLVSTENGSVRTLKKVDSLGIRKISFCPNNKYVAYDFLQDPNSSNHDLFLISLKDGNESRIVAHPANDYLMGWAPDGERIIFASDRSATNDAWSLRFMNGKPEGVPELIRKDIGQIFPLKITKDGSLYYAHLMSGMDVYTATFNSEKDAITSQPSRIAQGDVGFSRSPAFSRDGNFLIFQSISNPLSSRWTFGQSEVSLKIISFETSEVRQLFPEMKSVSGRTRLSPDGKYALLHGNDEKNGPGLYSIDLSNGKVSKVVADRRSNWVRQYHVSTDNSSVFYLMNKNGSIMRKDLAIGKEKKIYKEAADFDLSFDGRWIAVMNTDVYRGVSSLEIVSASGGEGTPIYKQAMPNWISAVAWMPDGEALIFSTGRRDLIDAPHRLWKISKNGGNPKDLGISSEYIYDLRFHPEGKQIAIWTVTDSSEVWVMENFLKPAM